MPSLRPYATWAEFGANLRGTAAEKAELLALFKAVYGQEDIHVNDVELFVGGLAEAPVGRSQMGSTFTWIFNEQLDRLQEGDRHYYFNQLKDAPLLLADIGSQHFSDLIMRNTGIEHMHYSAFKVSEQVELGLRERSHDFSAIPVSPDKVLVLVGNRHRQHHHRHRGRRHDLRRGGRTTPSTAASASTPSTAAPATIRSMPGRLGRRLRLRRGWRRYPQRQRRFRQSDRRRGQRPHARRRGQGLPVRRHRRRLAHARRRSQYGRRRRWQRHGRLQRVRGRRHGRSPRRAQTRPGLGGYAQGDVISGIENVVGSSFGDRLIGDDGRNRLAGGDGDDLLEGGAHRDTLIGGRGDDTYVVEGEGDRIVEAAGSGTDTVEVVGGSSYSLGDNLENLVYAGDYDGIARFTMAGNHLANALTGGHGSDRISGSGGDDTLRGLEGTIA